MKYLLLTFLSVIIGTLIFLFVVIRWFVTEKLETYLLSNVSKVPMIIERAYRARDYKASFIFSTPEALKLAFYPRSENEMIIHDEVHKKHVINKFSRELVEEMFKDGCIEMKEEEDFYNPYQRRVDLRIKVYQPEL